MKHHDRPDQPTIHCRRCFQTNSADFLPLNLFRMQMRDRHLLFNNRTYMSILSIFCINIWHLREFHLTYPVYPKFPCLKIHHPPSAKPSSPSGRKPIKYFTWNQFLHWRNGQPKAPRVSRFKLFTMLEFKPPLKPLGVLRVHIFSATTQVAGCFPTPATTRTSTSSGSFTISSDLGIVFQNNSAWKNIAAKTDVKGWHTSRYASRDLSCRSK